MRPNRVDLGWTAHCVPEALPDGSIAYVATHPGFPGVIGQGPSYFAACQEFDEMLEEVLLEMVASNIPVPRPNAIVFKAAVGEISHTVGFQTMQTSTVGPVTRELQPH